MAHTLLELALANTAIAALLAVVALLVGRWCKYPQVRYGLWLLVLLKLVTPPLHYVPIGFMPIPIAATDLQSSVPRKDSSAVEQNDEHPVAPLDARSAGVFAPITGEESFAANPASFASDGFGDAELLSGGIDLLDEPLQTDEAAVAQNLTSPGEGEGSSSERSTLSPVPTPSFRLPSIKWPSLASAAPYLLGIWLAGSLAWSTLVVYRSVRFGRMLRHTSAAPSWLNDQADLLAERFGLAQRPVVLLASGRLSPLLWAVPAKACIVLPRDIVRTAERSQVATLLAHELAHYRRGDHYCRWFELFVLSLFWWNPVAWWARRQLHRAEEECCDAWVVWALPEQSRVYAGAILETLDFLSGSQPVMPALASGLGTADVLERRLKMILQGTLPRQLSRRAQLSLLLAAAVVLPLSATAQDAAPGGVPGAGAPTVDATAPVASNGSAAPSAGLAPGTASNDLAPSAGIPRAAAPAADPFAEPALATPPTASATAAPSAFAPSVAPGFATPPSSSADVRPGAPTGRIPTPAPPAVYEAPDRSLEARMDRLEQAIQQLVAAQGRPGMVAGKPHKTPPALKTYPRYAPAMKAQPNSIGEIKKRRVDLEVQIDSLSEQIEHLKAEMTKLDKHLEDATKKREGASIQRAGATASLRGQAGDLIRVTTSEDEEEESAEEQEDEDDDDDNDHDDDQPAIGLRRS